MTVVGVWSKKEFANTPLARSSHSVSVTNDSVIVLGGENQARVPIDSTIHSLPLSGVVNDDSTVSWEQLSFDNAPPPRVAHSQVVIDKILYVFGGRQGITMDEAPLNDLYAFHLESKTWEQIHPSSLDPNKPSPRSFHRMTKIGSTIYVFGGCGASGRLSDLWEYDTTSQKWTQLAETGKFAGRGGAVFEASPAGDALFVLGGFTGTEMNDIWKFTIGTGEWESIVVADSFRPRSVCASSGFKWNGKNYISVFGGEVDPSEHGHEGAGQFLNDVFLLDCDANEIINVDVTGDLPHARGWTSAVVLASDKSQFIVFGGLAGDDSAPLRLSDFWILTFQQ